MYLEQKIGGAIDTKMELSILRNHKSL